MVFFFLFNMVGHQKVGYIFVSYVDIARDTLLWARGRPRPWSFIFFFDSFSSSFLRLQFSTFCPKQALFFILFSLLRLLCPNNIKDSIVSSQFPMSLETLFVSPMFLHTSRIQFKHSHEEDLIHIIRILHVQTNRYFPFMILTLIIEYAWLCAFRQTDADTRQSSRWQQIRIHVRF
jgi:hypothetical protein